MTVLLFVATILTFLSIDYIVRRTKKEPAPVARHAHVPALRFPEGIFFSKTHTWLNLFPSGVVQLGIDDFLSRMFARPTVTLLKAEGETVAKGESIIRMNEGENAFFVHSPIEGRITKLNRNLSQKPGVMKDELFLSGWAYTIEPNEGASALRSFFLGGETKAWIKSEFAHLRDFMAHAAMERGELSTVFLQDGGEPMPGILSHVTPEECTHFEEQFLVNE